ncbi:MAG TPA: TIGR01212 family radical SAM protein, partial [Anaerovoracaceae bacterium]|nr:TIGR01212 family radical SAM protein [Anaerovoracaceae bacterium]
MTYSKNSNPAINTVGDYLKSEFGTKTVKLSIDGGFTCPNRDGSKGLGGCIFCSADGSGEMASTLFTGHESSDCSDCSNTFEAGISEQIALLSDKWPNAKYIAYFQNHTNTYAPIRELRAKFYAALSHPQISGIAIATRPDCLPDDVLMLLEEINREHFMWVELGLQTIHEKTANLINRCCTLGDYDRAIVELTRRNIKVVTHLILGLPGESREDMFASVKYVCNQGNSHEEAQPSTMPSVWGLKLHLLNVVKGSQMETLMPNYQSFNSPEEYINLVVDLLEIIPPQIVMHRLTADAPRKILMTPEWSYKKRTILNGINAELKRRGSYQGCKQR